MFKVIVQDTIFIALVLEGFLCGLYSGIFAMYLQCHASKKDADKKESNIVFYSISALYPLCVVTFMIDTLVVLDEDRSDKLAVSVLCLPMIRMIAFACCDLIAQFILIYRCWIVWGCNIRVVIIPSILAFAFLVIWLTGNSTAYISSDVLQVATWAKYLVVSSLALSLIVNALMTGLIVFRIYKVFRKVAATSNVQTFGPTGGSKLRHAIMVLIESGITLFSIQFVRVVVTLMDGDAALKAFFIDLPLHNMFNGIIPTVIILRTVMGLSFHDEKSMEEFAVVSLNFAFGHPDPGQENRDDDVGIQRINDIEIIE